MRLPSALFRLFRRFRASKAAPVVLGTLLGIFVIVPVAFAQTEPQQSVMVTILSWLASLIDALNSVLLRIMVALIDVVMTVMTYNDFVRSSVVGAGWAIVRDTVNMFFVAALIYIALATMLNRSNVQWQQQVPRLMLFAIVINFSRLLVGLMVDAAQVVMLTFASALKSVGAGNFLSVFAINQTQLSSAAFQNAQAAGQTGGGAFDLFAASIASVILTVAALVLIIVILAVLVYRIAAIWALTIVAPIAWFIGGMGGIVSKGPYEKWWSNFKCAVLIGPVLTFFLWLTLAVAAAGNLAASNGFVTPGESRNVASISIAGFELDHLISFCIAFALILVGLDAAQQVCAGSRMNFINNAVGFAGRFATGAGTVGLVGATALGAARAGRGAGRLGLRGASAVGDRTGLTNRIQSSTPFLRMQQGAGALKTGVLAPVAGALGVGAAGAAAKQKHALHEADVLEDRAKKQEELGDFKGAAASRLKAAEERKHAAEEGKVALGDLAGLGAEDKAKMLKGMLDKGQLKSDPKTQTMLAEVLGDDKARKALDEQGVLAKMVEAAGGTDAIKNTVKGDKDLKGKFDRLAEARPDIGVDVSNPNISDKDVEKLLGNINSVDDIKKLDDKFLAKMGSNDKLKEAFNNKMKGIDSGFTDKDGKKQTVLDAFNAGRAGGKKRESLDGGMKGFYNKMAGGELEKQNASDLASAMKGMTPAEISSMVGRAPKLAENLMSNAGAMETLKGNPDAVKAVVDEVAKKPESFGDMVKRNPSILGTIPPGQLSDDMKRAAKANLNKDNLRKVAADYNKASPTERAAMENTMDHVRSLLNEQAQSGVVSSQQKEAADTVQWLEGVRQRAAGVTVNPSTAPKVGLESDVEELAKAEGELASERARMRTELEEIDRVMRVPATTFSEQESKREKMPRLQQQKAELEAKVAESLATTSAVEASLRTAREALNKQRVAQAAKEAEDRSRNSGGAAT